MCAECTKSGFPSPLSIDGSPSRWREYAGSTAYQWRSLLTDESVCTQPDISRVCAAPYSMMRNVQAFFLKGLSADTRLYRRSAGAASLTLYRYKVGDNRWQLLKQRVRLQSSCPSGATARLG